MSDKQTIVEVELTAERLALTIAQQRIADLEDRLDAAERRARVLERALARCVIHAKCQTILPITGDQLRDLCIAEAEAEEESDD